MPAPPCAQLVVRLDPRARGARRDAPPDESTRDGPPGRPTAPRFALQVDNVSGAAVIKGKCLGSMLIDNMTAVVGDRDAVTQMKLTFSVTSANQVVVLKAYSFKDRKDFDRAHDG